jgi:hypothetical protein
MGNVGNREGKLWQGCGISWSEKLLVKRGQGTRGCCCYESTSRASSSAVVTEATPAIGGVGAPVAVETLARWRFRRLLEQANHSPRLP